MSALTQTRADLGRRYRLLYGPSAKEVELVDVPRLKFLMADGRGDPNSPHFHSAMQTLYNLSYTLKFGLKRTRDLDYPVVALEALWWMSKRPEDFDPAAREKWKWTLMIMQPEFVTAADLKAAAEELRRKGKPLEPFRLEEFREGLSAQVMHVGPYSTENFTIKKIHTFMKANGYVSNGKHHEIYLGDPRRAAPSRLKTILRQPVRRAE